jgi:hypothetical protein
MGEIVTSFWTKVQQFHKFKILVKISKNSTSNAMDARIQRSLNKQWKSFKNTPTSKTFKWHFLMTQFTKTCDKTKNKEVESRPKHTLKRNAKF